MDLLKSFYEEEDGMGTVELVMIIAALMCVALLFKTQLVDFVQRLFSIVFPSDIPNEIDPKNPL